MVDLGVDTAELGSLAVGEVVHGAETHVDTLAGVVDGEDVDLAALVLDAEALAAVGRVPAGDGVDAADVGEARDVGLLVEAVAGDEAVLAVGAGDGCHGSVAIIVAGVVGDWMFMLVWCRPVLVRKM